MITALVIVDVQIDSSGATFGDVITVSSAIGKVMLFKKVYFCRFQLIASID